MGPRRGPRPGVRPRHPGCGLLRPDASSRMGFGPGRPQDFHNHPGPGAAKKAGALLYGPAHPGLPGELGFHRCLHPNRIGLGVAWAGASRVSPGRFWNRRRPLHSHISAGGDSRPLCRRGALPRVHLPRRFQQLWPHQGRTDYLRPVRPGTLDGRRRRDHPHIRYGPHAGLALPPEPLHFGLLSLPMERRMPWL